MSVVGGSIELIDDHKSLWKHLISLGREHFGKIGIEKKIVKRLSVFARPSPEAPRNALVVVHPPLISSHQRLMEIELQRNAFYNSKLLK